MLRIPITADGAKASVLAERAARFGALRAQNPAVPLPFESDHGIVFVFQTLNIDEVVIGSNCSYIAALGCLFLLFDCRPA